MWESYSSHPVTSDRCSSLDASHGFSSNWNKTNTRGSESFLRTPVRPPRRYVTAAIWEGRGKDAGRIGLAWADVDNCEWILAEFLDSAGCTILAAQLQLAQPNEVLIADSLNDRTANVLILEAVKAVLPQVCLTGVHRRFFSDVRGFETISQLSIDDSLVATLQDKSFCVAAMGALINFIQLKNGVSFHVRTIPFKYKDVLQTCMLDAGSWKNLEIFKDNAPSKDKTTLLSVIDNTVTSIGKRFLRANLLQPLVVKSQIVERQEAVAELLHDGNLLERVIALLLQTKDLSGFVNVCCRNYDKELSAEQAERHLDQLLHLVQTLRVVSAFVSLLQDSKCALLCRINEQLEACGTAELLKVLLDYVDASALDTTTKTSLVLKQQRLFAIQQGIDPVVDSTRQLYLRHLEGVQACEADLYNYLPDEKCRIAYSLTKGFHFVLTGPSAKIRSLQLPSVFSCVTKHRTCLIFTNKSLVRLNDEIRVVEDELLCSAVRVAAEVFSHLREHISVLYGVMDALATLDLLQSLAVYASSTSTSVPQFAEEVVIMRGRHPILDITNSKLVIPNDTYMTRDSRFAIITGPNMAGKSTLLKQVCHLSLLAQMGSFVPAVLFKAPLFYRIFSRVGHNDNLALGMSAFSIEMREMGDILALADSNTLIVIDELARSTSIEEGLAMSYATAELLLQKKSFVMLATHYIELAALDVFFSAVANYHILASDDPTENHRLFNGPYKGPIYGFDIVNMGKFPPEVLGEVQRLAIRLRNDSANRRVIDREAINRRATLRILHRLHSVFGLLKAADGATQAKYLHNLRSSFEELLAEMDCEMEDQTVNEDEESQEEEDDSDDKKEGEDMECDGGESVWQEETPGGGRNDRTIVIDDQEDSFLEEPKMGEEGEMKEEVEEDR